MGNTHCYADPRSRQGLAVPIAMPTLRSNPLDHRREASGRDDDLKEIGFDHVLPLRSCGVTARGGPSLVRFSPLSLRAGAMRARRRAE